MLKHLIFLEPSTSSFLACCNYILNFLKSFSSQKAAFLSISLSPNCLAHHCQITLPTAAQVTLHVQALQLPPYTHSVVQSGTQDPCTVGHAPYPPQLSNPADFHSSLQMPCQPVPGIIQISLWLLACTLSASSRQSPPSLPQSPEHTSSQ